MPGGVVFPVSSDDCRRIVEIATRYQVPLIPRAAGTSLAGQVVGDGLILDTSRHMTAILGIDLDKRTARVQTGVVVETLNQQLRLHGLMFAPDPSTLNRATVGGLIGNNAWGAHSPRYGVTRDHVLGLQAILADGSLVEMTALPDDALERKKNQPDFEGRLYQQLLACLSANQQAIRDNWPDETRVPNNMGYALNALLDRQPWSLQGEPFSLVPLLCGSEGTLALITEATVRLVPVPAARVLVAAHFSSLDEALQATRQAVAFRAAAVELLDDTLLSLAVGASTSRESAQWIDPDARALLLIELAGDAVTELLDTVEQLIARLRQAGLGYRYPVLHDSQIASAWAVRRASLGLLMGMPGPGRPVTCVEDSAVPMEKLPEFVADVKRIMSRLAVACVYYGSVSRGLIHIRPVLDLHDSDQRRKLIEITDAVARLLRDYGGSLSAKHGDGRLRGSLLEKQLGSEIVDCFRTVKRIFDPQGAFNPDKLFDSPAMDSDLRASSGVSAPVETFFDWSADNGLLNAVEKCHGAAACRRVDPAGTICPSYRATLEERDTTRGRANIFRQVLTGESTAEGICDDALHEALSLCIGCKACKKECPAGVDMARLKAEHLQHYHDRHGIPFGVRLLENIDLLAAIGSRISGVANWLAGSRLGKQLMGVAPARQLPRLAAKRLSQYFPEEEDPRADGRPQVFFFNDLFSEYFDVDIALKAIHCLEALGYRVRLSPCFPSLRVALSQGLVIAAKGRLLNAINWLHSVALSGSTIVGLEPSEVLTYRDEALALADNPAQAGQLALIADCVVTFEEFVGRHHSKQPLAGLNWPDDDTEFRLHGHCHQKALIGTGATESLLGLIENARVSVLDAGCCGMAGFFGYQKRHYDLSLKMAEQRLYPALRDDHARTVAVAPGFSCRHQIQHGVQRRALHPAEVLYTALGPVNTNPIASAGADFSSSKAE
jgi:FAD/FMN-containing dehydrogenase/Fe-S oxidoreductase